MSIKIKELTPEQEALFPEFVEKWVSIGLDTSECNIIDAVEAIKEVYSIQNMSPPEFYIGPVNTPYEGAIAEKVLNEFVANETEFRDAQHLNELVLAEVAQRVANNKKESVSLNSQIYGNADYWLSFYDYWLHINTMLPEENRIEGIDIVKPLIKLAESVGWWTPLQGVAIIQHKPAEIHRDEEHRLHNPDGYALKYRGDCTVCNLYKIHGVTVPESVIKKTFTAQDIEKEDNVEVRRVMLDIYGTERFLEETNAVEIHSDEFGVLYKKSFGGDIEDMYVVKVVNSTAEPDGTYKDYFLRVDPKCYGGIKTARAAVASTWKNDDGSLVFESPEDYDCSIET